MVMGTFSRLKTYDSVGSYYYVVSICIYPDTRDADITDCDADLLGSFSKTDD